MKLTVLNVLRMLLFILNGGSQKSLMDIFVTATPEHVGYAMEGKGRNGKNSRFAIITVDCFDRFG